MSPEWIEILLFNIVDALILFSFLTDYSGSRYKGFMKHLYFFTFSFAFVIAMILTALIITPELMGQGTSQIIILAISIAILFIYSFFFLNGQLIQKIFPIIFVLCLLAAVNFVVSYSVQVILGLRIDNWETYGVNRLFTYLLNKLLLLFCTRILLKFQRRNEGILTLKNWFIISTLSALLLISRFVLILITFVPTAENDNTLTYIVVTIVFFIAVNILIYYLYIKITNSNQLVLQLEQLKQQQEYEKRHFEGLTKQHEDIRAMRHNMKNQLIYIQSAIRENRTGDVGDFINKLTQDIENTGDYIRTDNYAFNCILNAMIAKAKESGIRIKAQITENIDTNLDPADASVILGNLLENAIEACNKLNKDERKIGITIEHNLIGLMIRIGNSTGVSVLNENPNFLTDKPDKEQHGLGVKSVRKLVQKYDGLMTCHQEEDVFYWTLLFKKSTDLV